MAPVLESSESAEPLPPPDPGATPFGASPRDDAPQDVPPQRPSAADVPVTVEPPRRRSGWHVAAIVIGALMLLPGFGAAAGGTALLVAQGTATDDGFFDITLDRVSTDGVAIATVDLWDAADDDDRPVVLDWLDVDIRLWVEGAGDTDDIFVGIARSEDVEAYLGGAEYTEVTGFPDRAPEYVAHTGTTSVEAPDDLDIWRARATGTGEQQVTWEARSGSWSVVVMNADGSTNVAADVEVGVRSDAITPIGIMLIVFGGVVLIAGTVLLIIGIRGHRDD